MRIQIHNTAFNNLSKYGNSFYKLSKQHGLQKEQNNNVHN